MNSNLILKTDVLDILFEHRNKAYGAYTLRKFYQVRLFKSVGTVLAFALIISALSFMSKPSNPYLSVILLDDPTYRQLPPADKKPDPPEKHNIPKPTVQSDRLVSSIRIVKNTDSTEKIETLPERASIGTITTHVPATGIIIADPTDPGPSGPNVSRPVIPVPVVIKEVYDGDEVDIIPSYPGGMNAFRKFMERNLVSPRDLEDGENILVKVKFIVGLDGRLRNFDVVQDGGKEFNEEVIRVLKKMPEWTPGRSKDRNVSVWHILPVRFNSAQ